MPVVSHVYTIDLVSEDLGVDSDWLGTLAYDNLDPEDGLVVIRDTGDKATFALTDHGIDLVRQLLADLPKP